MMIDMAQLNWSKVNDLMPVIIQDIDTQQVLMLGYMNQAAFIKTQTTQRVTFYSRTKQRLWTKGETSGHYLMVIDIHIDCDQDALLIQVKPQGPCCHLNTISCFDLKKPLIDIIIKLEQEIMDRDQTRPTQSYTAQLLTAGRKRIAQKVGEEGVEVALASLAGDSEEVKQESADLIFHLLVLLREQGVRWYEVLSILEARIKDK